jgi:hypothetical protein
VVALSAVGHTRLALRVQTIGRFLVPRKMITRGRLGKPAIRA